MIFASDLDQTLIYSKSFLLPHHQKPSLAWDRLESFNDHDIPIAIEYLDDAPLSYISLRAYRILKALCERSVFIPVTTRTPRQFQRIQFPLSKPLKYAIVNNGGTILVGGKSDQKWEAMIAQKLADSALDTDIVARHFRESIPQDSVKKLVKEANLFVYCIVNLPIAPSLEHRLNQFQKWLQKNAWDLYINGKKIYMIPDAVSKLNAIKYLLERLNTKKIVAAGDSLLDYEFLNYADIGLIPMHAKISDRCAQTKSIIKINCSGIAASYEILKKVALLLKQQI